MTRDKCPICRSERQLVFTARVLDRHDADFLKCHQCGFLGADKPWWLDEAYASAIVDADTGVLARSRELEPRLLSLFRLLFPADAVFADIGAGYGALVRTMRDAGLDFRWSDPRCPNLLARGFELNGARCAAVTAVEVLEHTVDPVGFIEEVKELTGASAVLLTTELLPEPVPDPRSWWYYTFPTGQHVSFLEKRTLNELGRRTGFEVRSRRNIHLLYAGKIRPWPFLIASTRLAPVAAKVLRRSMTGLTESDNPLLAPVHDQR